jgi:hypothetical protein
MHPSTRRWTVTTFRRVTTILVTIGLLAGTGVALASLHGCGGEQCLVSGENCTQKYKQDNYGTTSVQCCQGQCTDHGSGILTCGS